SVSCDRQAIHASAVLEGDNLLKGGYVPDFNHIVFNSPANQLLAIWSKCQALDAARVPAEGSPFLPRGHIPKLDLSSHEWLRLEIHGFEKKACRGQRIPIRCKGYRQDKTGMPFEHAQCFAGGDVPQRHLAWPIPKCLRI